MTNEKEFGEALKAGFETIEIEGDLAKKTIRIKATGKVAWGICLACIAIAISATAVTLGSGGTTAAVTAPTAGISLGAAATTLGVSTAVSATAIAAAGGGISALKKLRKYRLEKVSDTKIILHKK